MRTNRATVQILKALIETRFSEFLEKRDFKSEAGDSLDYFFRRKTDQRHELIEVQFDKYLRPKFILNFGIVPNEGLIDAYGRHVDADKVRFAHLVERGRLNAFPASFVEHWFGIGCLTLRSPERAADKEIEKLIKLFPQVERWFATGKAGMNLSVRTEPMNAPGVRKKYMESKGSWPPEGWTKEDEDKLRM